MLTYLHVKNIALIDELEVDFDDGLNIITGETGAGKSIIIGSIDAVLGQKLSKDFIRKDAEFALIELMFYIADLDVISKLKELGIEMDEELLISRKMSSNGRSVFKVNGETQSSSDIKSITTLLIDLHSQHEHQSLLEKKNHIKLLDRYLGGKINPLLLELKEHIKKYQTLKSESKDYHTDEAIRKREISFLEFEVDQLLNANLKIGEDEELEIIFRKQSNMHQIKKMLSEIYELVLGEETSFGVANLTSKAVEKMNHIRNLDSQVQSLSSELLQIDDLIRDFGRDLLRYADDLVIDEELLEETQQRISLINELKMKHGNTIEDILEVLTTKQKKLEHFIHFEERLKQINHEMNDLEKSIHTICIQITQMRQEGSALLSKKIEQALHDLNLKNAIFNIKISPKEGFSYDGSDEVEFMITTNTGEELKPLVMIASGGELSRVMLALKSVLADCDEIGTLIFDEIDTGISGRTAQMVAEKMVQLSRSRQIICITHLPQIAAMADQHFLIEKNNDEKRTITSLVKLKVDEIPRELARLVGGAKITESVLTSANEMKQLADDHKKCLFE